MKDNGEKRGRGRPKGALNKATADVKEVARQHVPAAIAELARLAGGAQSEAARVAAIKEILDRAYGKATTMIAGDPENPLRAVVRVELVGADG